MPLKIQRIVQQHDAAGRISYVSNESQLSTYPLHSRDQVAGTAEDAAALAALFNANVAQAQAAGGDVKLIGEPPAGYVLESGLLVED